MRREPSQAACVVADHQDLKNFVDDPIWVHEDEVSDDWPSDISQPIFGDHDVQSKKSQVLQIVGAREFVVFQQELENLEHLERQLRAIMHSCEPNETDPCEKNQGLADVEAIWVELEQSLQKLHDGMLVLGVGTWIFNFLWVDHIDQDQKHFGIECFVDDSAIFGYHLQEVQSAVLVGQTR